MLIEIDASAINDAIGTVGLSETSHDCIENLVLSHHAGKHVVAIEPEHVAALAQISATFSSRAKGALRSIQAQQTELGVLRRRMRWIMRVGLGPKFDGGSVMREGKAIILLPLHDFHDQERLGRSVLLGENLTDAALYRTIGVAFVASRNWRAQLCFEERGGGGSTTAPTFKQLVSDGKIVLAIADSDQRYPSGPIGGTAAKLLAIPRKEFQHIHVLHVRFAENLISSAIYQEAFAGNKQKLAALSRLKQAETLSSASPWRDHADLKCGLKQIQVRAITAGTPEAKFWCGVAVELQRDTCQKIRPVSCNTKDECGCYVTDDLGGDALALAVAWMKPRDPARNAKLLGLAPKTPIGDLCEKLLAWGIALASRPA
jgi:hypothetical protein